MLLRTKIWGNKVLQYSMIVLFIEAIVWEFTAHKLLKEHRHWFETGEPQKYQGTAIRR